MVKELINNSGYDFEEALLNEIAKVGVYKKVDLGAKLMDIGEYIKSMPLLISGAIKVSREDDDGNELLLYFLEHGETCAMTLTCCMDHAKSEIRAIAETDCKLIMVPVHKMEEWLIKYRSWRTYVLNSYHYRLNELLETIDNMAFSNMDERLLKYLKEKVRVTKSSTLKSTHQNIAYDLNTSRVVISRLLKKLENMGKLKINRYHLKIIDL